MWTVLKMNSPIVIYLYLANLKQLNLHAKERTPKAVTKGRLVKLGWRNLSVCGVSLKIASGLGFLPQRLDM